MSVRRLAPDSVQPQRFAFTPENLVWAQNVIAKYPGGRQASAVIPLLWRAQEQHDYWLPKAAMEYIADLLGMAKIRVLEVATFYTMFNLHPVGDNLVWQGIAFALFRVFDITKPWPARYYDRHVKNGYGVMMDDVVAALYTIGSLTILLVLTYLQAHGT